MVDGWRQGWWLPAGTSGLVTMTFEPQAWFEKGLLLGVAGVVLAILLALVGTRRPPRDATVPRVLPHGVAVAAMVLAGGLLAGWLGAAITAAVVAALFLVPAVRQHADLAAGGLLLLGGVAAAIGRSGQHLEYGAWVQWVLVAGLAAAFPAVTRPKRPASRRRMTGRSIT